MMWKKLKKWMVERFLPVYLREKLLKEIQEKDSLIAEQQREIDRLNAYISGMEAALRSQRRISIRNEVNGNGPVDSTV